MTRGGNRGARTPVDNARRNGRFVARKPIDQTIHEDAFNPQARQLVKQIQNKDRAMGR